MLLVLKAAESVLDWSPLSKLYSAVSRACYPEAEVRFPRTRGYGILLSKRMLGASVLISTKNFGKEKSGKVNWKTWCHPTILSSVIPFSCPQSFPESGSFPVSQLFASGGQSTGPSASASVLPMNIQCWFILGLIGLISLQSKGLSRVSSNTTVQNHQFFSAQLSLWSNSHIHTWLLEKP